MRLSKALGLVVQANADLSKALRLLNHLRAGMFPDIPLELDVLRDLVRESSASTLRLVQDMTKELSSEPLWEGVAKATKKDRKRKLFGTQG